MQHHVSDPVGIKPDLVNVPAPAKLVFLPCEILTGEYDINGSTDDRYMDTYFCP